MGLNLEGRLFVIQLEPEEEQKEIRTFAILPAVPMSTATASPRMPLSRPNIACRMFKGLKLPLRYMSQLSINPN